MKKIIISLAIFLGVLTANAQGKYKISGKIEGVAEGTLFLISYEKEKSDTLAVTPITNGIFEFTGSVNEPIAAYIMAKGQQGNIPLILENTDFVVNSGGAGVKVIGGTQQSIYNLFSDLNIFILREQKRIHQEFQFAEAAKDKVKMDALIAQFNQEIAIFQSKEKELLAKYADTYVAAHVVASSMWQVEPEVLKARYQMLGESAKATIPARSVANLIERQEKLEVGNITPDFTILDSDGRAISPKDVKGKVKLINFWASWSAPSRRENVEILKIYKKFQQKGFEVIGIAFDDNKTKWIKAASEDGIIWKSGSELKGQNSDIARLYFIRTLPYNVLLDENNVIVAKNLRGAELQKKIAELLKIK